MLNAGVLCSLLALTSALTCPDTSVCEDDSTCCHTPSNKYGCCPLPHAVCCEDHLHCCYEDTICDTEHARCLNETHSLHWLKRVPAELPKMPQTVRSFSMIHAVPVNLDFDNICPDETRCPGEFSCLKTHNGKYSCCPFPQGVSCFDGSHCCPNKYQCSKDGTSCTKSSERVEAVICPDGASECPDDTTCCQLPDGSWGCCPMAKAVCCEDKRHCCPEGTTCDLVHSMCLSPSRNPLPMWEKFPARRREDWEDRKVLCPDSLTACPDETTCCKLSDGSYGCCPMARAVCCEDHIHCCPEGTKCDLAHTICVGASGNTTWASKIPAHPVPPVESTGSDVPCNDSVACADGSTCCKVAGGEWACCPLPEAVCCKDLLHCCPHGTICNLVASTCDDPSGSTPWLEKVPTLSWTRGLTANDKCNSTTTCPGTATCCKNAAGDWACCPLPKAVCCEDHLHCCPQNTVCNLAASTCDDPSGSLPWLEKVPATPETLTGQTDSELFAETRNVTCDQTHACPSRSTCCQTEEGGWACCPLPKAVCCEDHLHCCPKGTVCNLAASTCDDPSGSVSWLVKVPALPQSPTNEKCDEQMVCPSGTTCCRQNSGEWACCPLPHAVCCEDHEHCCPKGYKCDVSQQTCIRPGELSLPWASKQPALVVGQTQGRASSSLPDARHCDSRTSCPRDTTCCYMDKMQKWGCCPLPNAVCCDDGNHCCPEGYKCNVARTSCERGGLAIPWYRKEEALGTPASPADVKCDAEKSCAAGTTCCLLPTGQWGCCPLVKAVCCSDHEHCCPQGYSCNLTSGTCERKDRRIFYKVPLFLVHSMEQEATTDPAPESTSGPTTKTTPRLPLKPTPGPTLEPTMEPTPKPTTESEEVHCDRSYHCQKTETCCMTSPTTWACCPSPKAVCCSDMKHCCPAGYSCDAVDGSCTKQADFNWDYFFRSRKRSFIPV